MLVAGLRGQVDGRRGRRHQERDPGVRAGQGHAHRADLVRGVAVGGDPVGADDRRVDLAAQDRACRGTVGLDVVAGCPPASSQAVRRDPWSSGRVSSAYTRSTRPRACSSRIDAEGRAPAGRGERAGVAVGEDAQRTVSRRRVRAASRRRTRHGAVRRDVLVAGRSAASSSTASRPSSKRGMTRSTPTARLTAVGRASRIAGHGRAYLVGRPALPLTLEQRERDAVTPPRHRSRARRARRAAGSRRPGCPRHGRPRRGAVREHGLVDQREAGSGPVDRTQFLGHGPHFLGHKGTLLLFLWVSVTVHDLGEPQFETAKQMSEHQVYSPPTRAAPRPRRRRTSAAHQASLPGLRPLCRRLLSPLSRPHLSLFASPAPTSRVHRRARLAVPRKASPEGTSMPRRLRRSLQLAATTALVVTAATACNAAAKNDASDSASGGSGKSFTLVTPDAVGQNEFLKLAVSGIKDAAKRHDGSQKVYESTDTASQQQNARPPSTPSRTSSSWSASSSPTSSPSRPRRTRSSSS